MVDPTTIPPPTSVRWEIAGGIVLWLGLLKRHARFRGGARWLLIASGLTLIAATWLFAPGLWTLTIVFTRTMLAPFLAAGARRFARLALTPTLASPLRAGMVGAGLVLIAGLALIARRDARHGAARRAEARRRSAQRVAAAQRGLMPRGVWGSASTR
jgi:membrane-bound ClpP family serine protease